MGIAVLGPLEIDGHRDGLAPRDRVVLSVLVVRGGETSRTDTLADALWGERPPASWSTVVHGCIARLRKRLGAAAIESGPAGYRLTLTESELDCRRFERLLERAREVLDGDDPERAAYVVQEALDLWRGPALSDLEEWEPGRVEAARLDGLRMDAEEVRVEAGLRAGHARDVLELSRALAAQAPFRERRWALLAQGLHQTGRQAEALGALRRARALLVEQFGLDPGRELVDLEQSLLRGDSGIDAVPSRAISTVSPYRGLLPYGAEDVDIFFGREDDLEACLRRLRDSKVLAVVGPSGIGKSSLLMAGVVAALARAATPVLLTTPGARPLDSLADLRPRGRQTVVVDQAEEAVTLCSDPAEREQFFAALAAHVGAGGSLALSLRADHLGDLAPYPDIARILEEGLYLLGPMGEANLRAAVEGPARRAGFRLEPGLVDLLVREVEGEPAALPLLSHVMRETWSRREGPTLTVEGYRATGGIRHAVSQTAESLYEAMNEVQRHRLRNLLLRLVVPSEAGDPVSAPVPRARLLVDDAHARLVEDLVDARLLSIDGDTVQLAHESLARVWPRLRGWLDDDVEGLRLLRHLAGAADAWDAMARPESELYRGARLSRMLEWCAHARADLSEAETAFLEASATLAVSEEQRERERSARERRTNRRLRGALAGVGVLGVLAVVAGGLAVRSAERADAERDQAQAAADLADARRAGAVALTNPDLPLSLLLATSALEVDDSAASWDSLTGALMRSPSMLRPLPLTSFVVDLDTSPDGALLAVSQPVDGVGLALLDAATHEPLPLADHTASSGVAFSPDSRQVAVAVNQWPGDRGGPPRIDPQPVRLFDVPSGNLSARQLGGFPEGASVEYALGFSGDGRRLVAAVDQLDPVTGAVSHTFATVWDLAEPSRPVLELPVSDYPVLELSPDASRLHVALTGGEDRPFRTYDVESGRLLAAAGSASLPLGTTGSGDLSPNGSTLAVPAADMVLLIDTGDLRRTRPPLLVDPGVVVERAEFSHDGTLVAGATREGQVLVWDSRTGKQVFAVEEGASWGIGFSADDSILLSGPQSWDLSGTRGLFAVGKGSRTAAYDVSKPGPDGHTLVRQQGHRMWFVDDRTGRRTVVRHLRPPDLFHDWSSDATRVLSWRDGGTLRLWDTATGRLLARRDLADSGPMVSAFHTSGEEIYVNAVEEHRLLVLDPTTLTPVRAPIDLGARVLAVEPHPDGTVIAVADDGAVLRVAPSSGRVQRVAGAGTLRHDAWEVELSADGTRLLGPRLTEGDDEIELLDVTTWKRLGSAPWDGELGRYDLSPDGTQLATLEADQLVLHDGRDGSRVATIDLPGPLPQARLTYLPDSSGVLLTGLDGRTWTLPTRPESWVARACELAGRDLTREEWEQYFPGRSYRPTCPGTTQRAELSPS